MDTLITYRSFTFNPFQENTYVIYDAQRTAVIIDPGCCNSTEEQMLSQFIANEKLQVKALWLSHGHIDHVLGLAYCQRQFQVNTYMHPEDVFLTDRAIETARLYGLSFTPFVMPLHTFSSEVFWNPFQTEISLLHLPGHSPGSIGFYFASTALLFCGDVIMRESIGRTDLPGGSYEVLKHSIKNKIYTLPETVTLLSGHGPETTVAWEKKYNPFVSYEN
jgi:hydroxyacylglutathione hydrolase